MLQPGKMQEIADTLTKHRMDFTSLQEIRWKGCGRIDKRNFTLLYSGNSRKQGERGVGFIINSKIKKSLMEFIPINDRLCVMRIKGKFNNITVINAYAPTEDAGDDEKEVFYNDLHTSCDNTSTHDTLLLMGDFNAKVGKEDIWSNVCGKHSLHMETSGNGERLCTLANATNLIVKSTSFPHKDIHKGTWVMPGNRAVNQIDHILINKRRSSSIIDIRAMRGPNCDSDHFLVRGLLRQRIAINIRSTVSKSMTKWNTDALAIPKVQSRYEEYLIKNLEMEERNRSENTIDTEWSYIKDSIINAAGEVLGKVKKERNVEWYDEECRTAVEIKNAARKRMLQVNTRTNKQEYDRLRRIAKSLCRKKKREQLNRKLENLNEFNNHKQTRKFYQEIKEQKKRFEPRLNICKNSNGTTLTQEEQVLQRWKEHFSALLNKDNGAAEDEEFIYYTAEQEIEEPSLTEVSNVIKKLKNNKSPGSDTIPSELIKHGGEKLVVYLHNLLCRIWREEIMPSDWKIGIICPIHKKGDKQECSNYRGISLLNIVYKILSSVIFNRLDEYAEDILGEYQAGFRKARSTVDHIHTMRQMLEKCYEHNITLHNLYVDYRQAFDTVNRRSMTNRLLGLGIPKKITNLIKMTLTDTKAVVRVEKSYTEPFDINTGVRQGDSLSALLFILTMESVIRATGINGTIKTKSRQLLAYADDIVVTTKNKQSLDEAYTSLQNESALVGLEVNEKKTSYMINCKIAANNEGNNIVLNGMRFARHNNVTYLGVNINSQNSTSTEIQARIQAANRASFAYKNLLSSKLISRATKLKIYKTLIRPIATYACETWSLKQGDLNKLSIFERRILRKIFGPVQEECGGWRTRMNFELDRLIQEETIVRFVKSRRLQWFGHLQRMPETRLPAQFTNWVPLSARGRGRPRKRWKEEVTKDLQEMKIKNWGTKVKDRMAWKRIVEQAKTHIGL